AEAVAVRPSHVERAVWEHGDGAPADLVFGAAERQRVRDRSVESLGEYARRRSARGHQIPWAVPAGAIAAIKCGVSTERRIRQHADRRLSHGGDAVERVIPAPVLGTDAVRRQL